MLSAKLIIHSLLYHALHILLRRPYLSSPARDPNDRNITSCIEHSKKVHAIHSLYSQTFPHRLMTYQVSYCIYTAATVETEELKRASTKQEREDAAARLAAAFQILQKEASHTPGSGRSLDTIRRLLSTGPPRAANVGSHPDRNQAPALGQNGYAHQASHHQWPPFNGRTGGERPEQTCGRGQHALSSAIQSTPYNNSNTGSNNNPRLASSVNPVVDDNSFFPMDVSAWDDDFSFGGTDTGAGFHPDAFPWGVAGPVLRNPVSSSLANSGVVWPSNPPTEGVQ